MTESLVNVEVGGEKFPYKTEPRCFVCSDNNRLEMEKANRGGTFLQAQRGAVRRL